MPKTAKQPKPEPTTPAIPWDKVGKLLEAGATIEGVALMIGIRDETLVAECKAANGVDFQTFAEQRRVKGEELLRVKTFQNAMAGDKASLARAAKDRQPHLLPVDDSTELLSLSQVAERCDLDRTTTRKRLAAIGIEPEKSNATLKLYRFDKRLLDSLTRVKTALEDIRARKETAAAIKLEMHNDRMCGELVPVAATVEIVQRIVGTIYQEFTVRQAKRIAPKLTKAKNVMAVKAILRADTERVFKSLRENFERFIAE